MAWRVSPVHVERIISNPFNVGVGRRLWQSRKNFRQTQIIANFFLGDGIDFLKVEAAMAACPTSFPDQTSRQF